MMLVDTAVKHLVFFAYDAWGHNRPLCAFAARVVRSEHTHITYIVPGNFLKRVRKELRLHLGTEGDANKHLSLIRVVGIPKESVNPLHHEALDEAFGQLFKALSKGEPITCPTTGVVHSALPRVHCAVIDIYAYRPLEFIRQLGPGRCNVYVWYSPAANRLLTWNGPDTAGAKNRQLAVVAEEAEDSGHAVTKVAAEICLTCDGSVITIPGLPPMHDYELFPQKFLFKEMMGVMNYETYLTLEGCDGIILSTPECYEPVTIQAVRKYYRQTSRSVYVCGPLTVSEAAPQATICERQHPETVAIENMLDDILRGRGKHTLLYISFGSLFWPPLPDRLWAVLDVVMESGIPFIMAHASAWAIIPESIQQKVNAYPFGMMSRWCPQHTILAHEATGWFLTHGGHNSVIEAIGQGVPMICWPYQFDQPTNAIHLSCNLDVAYEMYEVRTDDGLRPIHHLGRAPEGTVESVKRETNNILQLAFGEDGARKRRNIEKLRVRLGDAWTEDGPATRELRAFLSSLDD